MYKSSRSHRSHRSNSSNCISSRPRRLLNLSPSLSPSLLNRPRLKLTANRLWLQPMSYRILCLAHPQEPLVSQHHLLLLLLTRSTRLKCRLPVLSLLQACRPQPRDLFRCQICNPMRPGLRPKKKSERNVLHGTELARAFADCGRRIWSIPTKARSVFSKQVCRSSRLIRGAVRTTTKLCWKRFRWNVVNKRSRQNRESS
mmetsp:Transcript_25869/g.37884  ORF Transcript_25869/g.37884 Transcript_25869/m.37884 type:complete len:200 (+) Transcript_25869:450-1049(+)